MILQLGAFLIRVRVILITRLLDFPSMPLLSLSLLSLSLTWAVSMVKERLLNTISPPPLSLWPPYQLLHFCWMYFHTNCVCYVNSVLSSGWRNTWIHLCRTSSLVKLLVRSQKLYINCYYLSLRNVQFYST